MLQHCPRPLWEQYDIALLDLDGVVYVGPEAVDGAPEQLRQAVDHGMHLAYVTNSAARPPAQVAAHLRDIGVPAEKHDVVTSAQAAARLVARDHPAGSTVYVIGGPGLEEALRERDLVPVQDVEPRPTAVVSGFHRDLRWGTVVDGAILVAQGVPWYASNTDMSVPTPHGNGPGNGVLVDAVARFAGIDPRVAGKPQPPLFEETLRRVGGDRPLVVGDRLDTDIEGAVNTCLDSLLVMTGVTDLEHLVRARPGSRPTYLAGDLTGLAVPHPVPDEHGRLGGWTADVVDGALRVQGEGADDDWWRVAAAVAWRHLDLNGEPVDVSRLFPPGNVTPQQDAP
jgi:glycerol 3-phosphatase-2